MHGRLKMWAVLFAMRRANVGGNALVANVVAASSRGLDRVLRPVVRPVERPVDPIEPIEPIELVTGPSRPPSPTETTPGRVSSEEELLSGGASTWSKFVFHTITIASSPPEQK